MTKKELIKEITVGKNINGYTTAIIDCYTKDLDVVGINLLHSGLSAIITSASEEYAVDTVRIPFEYEPNTDYTVVQHINKDQITLIIVPLEFIGIKGVDYA